MRWGRTKGVEAGYEIVKAEGAWKRVEGWIEVYGWTLVSNWKGRIM